MNREAEPILRPKKRHKAANMKDALAALERSKSIHFLKRTLPRTSMPGLPRHIGGAYLVLPARFVREHADKVLEWVTLRVQSSNGRSSRPWTVRLSVFLLSATSSTVQFRTGWKDFAAGNGLKEGDSLIFLLKEGVKSEFEVHVFRGPEGSPNFPDLCASSTSTDDDDDEEEKFVSNSKEEESFAKDFDDDDDDDDDKQSPVSSHVHHRDAHKKASVRHGRASKAAAEQQTKHSEDDKAFPNFRKVMTVTNIRYSASSKLTSSGQFEFPLDFLKTHSEHFQASVQLQGVHDDSPVHVIPCSRTTWAARGCIRVYFKPCEWNRFVKANRLKVGQRLPFSLTGDTYFKVRVI